MTFTQNLGLTLPSIVALALTGSIASTGWAADWEHVQEIKKTLLTATAQHAMEQQKTTAAEPVAIAFPADVSAGGGLKLTAKSADSLAIEVMAEPEAWDKSPASCVRIQAAQGDGRGHPLQRVDLQHQDRGGLLAGSAAGVPARRRGRPADRRDAAAHSSAESLGRESARGLSRLGVHRLRPGSRGHGDAAIRRGHRDHRGGDPAGPSTSHRARGRKPRSSPSRTCGSWITSKDPTIRAGSGCSSTSRPANGSRAASAT